MPKLLEEQIAVINHDSGNIMVSASAGSGKTFVMIERMINLIINQKAKVSEILAMTFTELASSQIKAKLRSALISKINQYDCQLNENGDNGELQAKIDYLTEQLNELSVAQMSTVHSFCSRLIRTYFYVVGLSPDFSIVDDKVKKLLIDRAMNITFSSIYEQGDKNLLTFIARNFVKRSDKLLREQIEEIYNFACSEMDENAFYNKSIEYYTKDSQDKLCLKVLERVKKQLQKIQEQLLQAFDYFVKVGDSRANFCEQNIENIELVLKLENLSDIAVINYQKPKLTQKTKLDQEGAIYKEIASNCRDSIDKIIVETKKMVGSLYVERKRLEELKTHTQSLIDIVKLFSQNYSKLKREENLLDFNDLEHFALEILRDESISLDIKQKYKYIFVDEYQDTNGVQEGIINLLANDNLFLVGDAKQSIYGFRGCRPDFFINKYDKMKKGQTSPNGCVKDTAIELNYNFRSSQKVIDMVNAVFSFSMTKENFGIDYKTQAKLLKGNGLSEEHCGRAQLYLLEKDKKQAEERSGIYNILEGLNENLTEDSSNISKLIADIIEKEITSTYFEHIEGVDQEKRINYSDICILTRNKDNDYVHKIVEGLNKHGIPTVSQVAENVCDFPEVKWLICSLRLIDTFLDEISLATVLKSPIVNLTDEDLFSICWFYKDNAKERFNVSRTFYDMFDFYLKNADTSLRDRLVEFVDYFNQLRLLADFTCAYEVLEKIVFDKNLFAYLYASSFGSVKAKHVRRFIDASLEGGKMSVKEFLDCIDNDEKITLTLSGQENAVNVMTIHASKGLEFPVVILAGLEHSMNSRSESGNVLLDRDYGIAVKYYDDSQKTTYQTFLREQVKENLKSQRIKEELRLLYVAMTRARYSLHMTYESAQDNRSDNLEKISRFIDYIPLTEIPATTVNVQTLNKTRVKSGVRKVVVGKAEQSIIKNIDKNLGFIYPYSSDTVLPLKSSVTDAIKGEQEEYYAINHMFFEDEKSSTTKEKGIIAHKFLELYDFSCQDFENQVQSVIDSKAISKEELNTINLQVIKNALSQPIFSGISDSISYREKSFIVSLPAKIVLDTSSESDILVQGVIDLLIDRGEYFDIIDYKYSSLPSQRLKQKYGKQLSLYAMAINKITGKPVKNKAILSLINGEIVYVE